ncbi:proline dehydrogenase family protein [Desulfobacula toluolica]|uniref:proline dehydrogenase n=1 Tax=Desulfobacula toluolica (strain DSM 7467 / Tol2) TaxID=651182 RepID=K0NCF0_DESTT|nr:proline dehydrogenase family protein [Desulfobacula toluolica]CCK78496.1 PutA: proline dehydrogenase [Desulfobacula toluolica Tol2]
MIRLNRLIAQLLFLVPKSLVEIFAKQYIAGETLSQALEKTRELNDLKIDVTLDFLGEDPQKKRDCRAAVDVYKKAIKEIHNRNLKSGISLKPSQMGLKINKQFCFDNLHDLIDHARKHMVFVRIDMEDTSLKEDTIDLYLKLKKEFENVGIVMQAYLRSAIADINGMIQAHANIRLCKGAYYWEDRKVAYKDMNIINSSYAYLMEKLLSNNCFTGIATHDEKLLFEAMKLIDKLGVSKEKYEFQMLYGVQEDLRKIIHDHGHSIRVYVPFGKDWFAYSVRRLKENPKMVSYIFTNGIKNIFSH